MDASTTISIKRASLTGSSLVAFLAIAHVTNDALTSMFAALLPTIQDRYGLTETVLALLVATLALSSSVTQPLFGGLSDWLGRRLVASLGIIMSASLLSLIGVVPTVYLLFGLLFAGGLGSAAFHPAGSSMARDAGGANRGLAVSLFSAGGTVGMALGPVIVLFIVSTFGLSFTPWLMIPGVILGLTIYLVVPTQDRLRRENRPKLFDARLFTGPVGLLCIPGIFISISSITFISAMPLWLVSAGGAANDASVIGWTLATFSLSAALGGILAAALSGRVRRRTLISASMLLSILPLFSIFHFEPGSLFFFLAVMLAGGLVSAGMPLLLVTAQDLAPHVVATASGMLMGFTSGIAGLLYIGIGRLQETVGLTTAMSLSYLSLIPGAVLAFEVLTAHEKSLEEAEQPTVEEWLCACSLCTCSPCLYPKNLPIRRIGP